MILQPVHLGDVTGLQQICTPEKQHVFFNRTFLSEVSFPPKPPRKNTHTHIDFEGSVALR